MNSFPTRRHLLALAGTVCAAAAESDPWSAVPAILKRIQAPQFPAREFLITKFGAVGDGAKDCTVAIRSAVAACAKAGGGRVVVPPGVFRTGAIHLLSNVCLHTSARAMLQFSRDPRDYPLVFTRWEGVECMNYSPLIYAFEQTNVGITGEGVLDGQSDCEHWWPWKGRTNCGWKKGDVSQAADRDALLAYAERNAPVRERVFGQGHFLRPQFVQPYRCKNVLIEGITIRNSPMWEIHPALCSNVTVRGVKVNSHGPNNDGCNPESSRDVLIENCEFDTGDDCIAIKSGRNQDGRRVPVPSENIIVRGCTMKAGHGGVTIGSEITAGVRNVFVEDCRMSSPDLNSALRIKNNAARGGVIERIRARNIQVGQVGVAIEIDFLYEEGAKGAYKPVVRDLLVSNLTCGEAKSPWTLRGLPNAPIEQVRVEYCTFDHAKNPGTVEHVNGLQLKQVKVNGRVLG